MRVQQPLSSRRTGVFLAAVVVTAAAVMCCAAPTMATAPPESGPVTTGGAEPTEPSAPSSSDPAPATTAPDPVESSTAPTPTEPAGTAAPSTSEGTVPTTSTEPGAASSVPSETTVDSAPASSEAPLDSAPASSEPALTAPAVSASLVMFVDDDGDLAADLPGAPAIAGGSTGLTIVATAVNASAGPIDALAIAAPSAIAPEELAKLDVTAVYLTLPAAGSVTVTYGDGSVEHHDVAADGALAVSGPVVAVTATFGAGPGSIDPGAAATLTLHGTLGDAVGADDLGDGADPGIGVCVTATATGAGTSASTDACDFVDVEAAPEDQWVMFAAVLAAWTLSGANPSWTGTSTLPAVAFPPATFATDSRTPTIPSGASAFLGPDTPFATTFASTQNEPYLNLRPALGSAPSTTTFTFPGSTPIGWGFAFGDVDADLVTISAVGPSGPLTVAQLGFEGVFNYCQSSPVPSSCVGGSVDVPVWDAATATLIGNGTDSTGAAGWFRPTVPITELTFVYARQIGTPIIQVWFAAASSNITGQVTDETGGGPVPAPPPTAIELRAADGSGPLLTIPIEPDGTFTIPDVASQAYQLVVVPPAGYEIVGPGAQLVDASAGDAAAAFVIRQAGTGPTTTSPETTTTTQPGATTTTQPGATTTQPGVTTTDPGVTTTQPEVTTTTQPGVATTSPGATTTTAPGATGTSTLPGGVGGEAGEELPVTGSDPAVAVLAALLLLATGAALLATVRRPRASRR